MLWPSYRYTDTLDAQFVSVLVVAGTKIDGILKAACSYLAKHTLYLPLANWLRVLRRQTEHLLCPSLAWFPVLPVEFAALLKLSASASFLFNEFLICFGFGFLFCQLEVLDGHKGRGLFVGQHGVYSIWPLH